MIIVRLQGGMGNQMFQYALYKEFLYLGYDAKLEPYKFKHIGEPRSCFLNFNCFDLDYEICSRKEARKYVVGTGMLSRLIVKFWGDKPTRYVEAKEYEYDSDVLKINEGYLDGYWQSPVYFNNIADKIKKEFRFTTKLSQNEQLLLGQICHEEKPTVAIHVRRGDYLNLPELYGNICTEEYYQKAISYIEKKLGTTDIIYYFFSNDMEWVKGFFGERSNHIFVEGAGEERCFVDMQMMSSCKHQIIANSSFSWWAAYLNDNTEKIIVAPSRWIGPKDTPDVYCKDWVQL